MARPAPTEAKKPHSKMIRHAKATTKNNTIGQVSFLLIMAAPPLRKCGGL